LQRLCDLHLGRPERIGHSLVVDPHLSYFIYLRNLEVGVLLPVTGDKR